MNERDLTDLRLNLLQIASGMRPQSMNGWTEPVVTYTKNIIDSAKTMEAYVMQGLSIRTDPA